MTRLLVTGSRDWTDRGAISLALRTRFDRDRTAVLVSGGCPTGADYIAEGIWESLGGMVERHPADRECEFHGWEHSFRKHGRFGGPVRNNAMVSLGADECLAFPLGASRGTRGCMAAARKAGIPVTNYGDQQ